MARPNQLTNVLAALGLAAGLSACGDDDAPSNTDTGVPDTGTPDTGTPDTGVPDAGDGGVDAGLTRCEQFCADYAQTCMGGNNAYASTAACESACDGWPIGVSGAASGNTLECRITHLDLAKQGSPATHCAHAGPDGDNTCVDS